ncbi:DMT family transporter [Aliishimia ponticola]|uniref:DMT family transporter n=1 Tax=Aliishimia ponticola TaxID=2499833 RepID=A0A4S4N926_9RHOB|nr:DMT family transporter [Aliishimia ponticola]THH35732.1 DMT family transporter [Aliishimia ponticola]
MSLWIVFSLAAAVFQTLRFMLQKTLSQTKLSAGGATFARFLYSAPLAVAGITAYLSLSGQSLPPLPPAFWAFGAFGGLTQVIATICVVLLFQSRNFAVGVAFAKTEVILTVLVGLIVLGEGVSAGGLMLIALGVVGVVLLSVDPAAVETGWRRLTNRAAGLGIASGLLFACSGVCYRAASLQVVSGDPLLRAGVTLAAVTSMQMLGMWLWLRWREAGQTGRVLAAWRSAGFIGLTSMAGSFCWFTAFTLQIAAYVKAVGQVELIFGLAAATLVFKEAISRRELLGMAILALSILGLVLAVPT